ncbi:hypothetical protein [Teredinibacter turnerae]|uniref:hypothetical protein n=1 Tax=Teredinibacter turnerae TaxID=2426 RepID=UPI0005F80263|nr:hypothetical protein [Teredinibacter turnerae]
MKCFRDITSFHSIKRAINGNPTSKSDIIDFLNFLSQLIFCDNVYISKLGPDLITKETELTVDSLCKLGVPKDFVVLYSYPDEKIKTYQRETISNQILSDWLLNFPEMDGSTENLFPEKYFNILEPSVDLFYDVFARNGNINNYKEQIELSRHDDEYSYMIALILENENLTELIKNNVYKENISKKSILSFLSKARHKYNIYLAQQLELAFTPSHTRSSQNKNNELQLLKNFEKILLKTDKNIDAQKHIKGKNLSIPSALHLLISKKNTKKEDLIETALKYRENLKWYRDEILNDYNKLTFSGDYSDTIKLEEKLTKAFHEAACDLKYKPHKGCKKTLFNTLSWGETSVDLSDFSKIIPNIKFKNTYEAIKSLNRFRKDRDRYILTLELASLITKGTPYYEKKISFLYFSLGGSLSKAPNRKELNSETT